MSTHAELAMPKTLGPTTLMKLQKTESNCEKPLMLLNELVKEEKNEPAR